MTELTTAPTGAPLADGDILLVRKAGVEGVKQITAAEAADYFGSSGGGGGGGEEPSSLISSTDWQLKLTNVGGGPLIGFSELQFLDKDGVNVGRSTGATYFDSSHYDGGRTAAQAFDNNTGQDYGSGAFVWGEGQGVGGFVGFTTTAPVTPTGLNVFPFSGHPSWSGVTVQLQYKVGGIWTDLGAPIDFSTIGLTGGSGSSVVLQVETGGGSGGGSGSGGSVALGAHRYWEFSDLQPVDGQQLVWSDCSLFDAAAVALVPTAVTADTAGGGGGPASVFDGSLTSNWDRGHNAKTWLRVDLGSAHTLGSFKIRHRSDYSGGYMQSPRRFTLRYSDDGVYWTEHPVHFAAVPDYANNADERTFVVPQTIAAGGSGGSGGVQTVGKAIGGGTNWGGDTSGPGVAIPGADFTFHAPADGVYLVQYHIIYNNNHRVRGNIYMDGALFSSASGNPNDFNFSSRDQQVTGLFALDMQSVGALTAGAHTVSTRYNAMDATNEGGIQPGSFVTVTKLSADFA